MFDFIERVVIPEGSDSSAAMLKSVLVQKVHNQKVVTQMVQINDAGASPYRETSYSISKKKVLI
jgi:hypothetical protein